ncbi:MAG TPA: hypothetical protein PK367_03045 [Candidatus Paceibacterota bacterium]|nr:hypothetical protein [Candidatus Paceibacterota bacterium]
MFKGLLKGNSKMANKISWVVGGLIIIAFLIYLISPFSGNNVPSEFTNARALASVHAQEVVGLLEETSNNLSKIKELENSYQWKEALNVTYKEINKYNVLRDKALDLTSQLEIMAKSVPDISPRQARELALVAISSEVTLVTTLNNYINGDLSVLLELLRQRLLGRGSDYNSLNKIVDNMNAKKESINNLNNQFSQLMGEFDKNYQ